MGSVISEKSLVPVGIVVVIVAIGMRFANVEAVGRENSNSIVEIEKKQDDYQKTVNQINVRLGRIEGAMHIKGE